MLVYEVRDYCVRQHLAPHKYLVPNGSQQSIQIGFIFDKEWSIYPTKFVQFAKFGLVYNVMLNDKNTCYLPAQLDDGDWSVGVFAIMPDIPCKRMTSINSKLTVVPCSYKEGGKAPPPVERDYYSLLFHKMEELAKDVTNNSDKAEQAAIAAVEAKKTCEELAEAAQGNIDKITESVLGEVKKEVYTKNETYSKADISTEGEIALTSDDIDAILV